jgi:uncharacterized protein (UPF0303 family)
MTERRNSVTDLEGQLSALIEEEETIQFTCFPNELALRIGLRLAEVASEDGKAIVVDVRRGGQQLFHYALPGTSPDNDEWVRRKQLVVERFGHSSYYIGTRLRSQGATLEEKYLLDPREYAAHGGSFPIVIRGVGVVGAVTVSGLPQEEDHQLVVRVLKEFCEPSAQ